MNILCDHAEFKVNKIGDKAATVICHGARADLVIQEVIDEKGAEFVLQAVGDKAIADYLNKQAIPA